MKKRPLSEKLWSRVDIQGSDDCWEWRHSKAREGYGRIKHGRTQEFRAHRVSWELVNGPIPDGLVVCHKCDNPPCCNPNHLFLGTRRDNHRDMLVKGRAKFPPVRRGDNHHKCTIPDANLPDIKSDARSLREISEQYGVSTKTIWRIKHGLTRNYENQSSRN